MADQEDIDIEKLNDDLVVPKGDVARVKGALAMRMYGATYNDIAEVQGYSSARAAKRAVEAALVAVADHGNKDHLIAMASARLDKLLVPTMKKALDPKHPEQQTATRMALALIDRHAKLHGLDQPVEVRLKTATSVEIDTWVEKARALEQPDLPEEADIEQDIVDAEVVPDEDEESVGREVG